MQRDKESKPIMIRPAIQFLSEKMRERIAGFGWKNLTDIQEKTIPLVYQSDKDLIIEAETASGKTEAVFLPILSKLEEEGNYKNSVKVLYISPLKALINDQFERVFKITEDMHIRVVKWHGDVSHSKKKHFLEHPSGILQITPESIEAFMVNRPEKLAQVFSGVEYIVIDEVHSFVGSNRGYHLQSLLYRLGRYFEKKPRVFGLSATVGGIDLVKKWMNPDEKSVELVESRETSRKTLINIQHIVGDDEEERDAEIVKDILKLTAGKKALVFCNSRFNVEKYGYLLNKALGCKKFYAHHSYIDKSLREEVENLVKKTEDISIICTSTLELGIDIGSVDIVLQIDCTHSVSALKQRIGRTGRRAGQDRIGQIYTTEPAHLLAAIATVEAAKENRVEAPEITKYNYDYLFQQIISMVIERNGVRAEELVLDIKNNPVFSQIEVSKIAKLIKYMIEQKYLSIAMGTDEIIIGHVGEKMAHNKDFYAMFMATEPFSVYYGSKKIGMIDECKKEGQGFSLYGQAWVVKSVDVKLKKIYVEKLKETILTHFASAGGERSKVVRQKLMEILKSPENLPINYVNKAGQEIFEAEKALYRDKKAQEKNTRVVTKDDTMTEMQLFLPPKVLNAVSVYLTAMNYDDDFLTDDYLGNLVVKPGFDVDELKKCNFNKRVKRVIDEYALMPGTNEFELRSKYYPYLSEEMRQEIYLERWFDFEGAEKMMPELTFVHVCEE